MKDLIERLREWNRQYRGTIMDDVLEAADALEQAQARIAELEAGLAFKEALLAGDGALITGLKEENTALALQVEQMREALNSIASWHEGEEVGGHFDEPGSAFIARKALSTAPATEALAEYRRKVIEGLADYIENKWDFIGDELLVADDLRALAAAPDGDKVEKEVG